jgi:uncharacterized membrane protein YedE/YeeE
MAFSDRFISIGLGVLVILAIIFAYAWKKGPQKQPSRIAFIALFLVVAGILFGEDSYLGKGLPGAGIVLGVVDILIGLKKFVNDLHSTG